jgi:hypothetical protein
MFRFLEAIRDLYNLDSRVSRLGKYNAEGEGVACIKVCFPSYWPAHALLFIINVANTH